MGSGGSVPTERGPLETLMPQPASPKYKLAVVGYQAPGGFEMNTDKSWVEGRAENSRYDSVPIANGVIMAGGSCELFDYTPDDHDGFAAKVKAYDALIVRINPGQLSAPGVKEGAQMRFDGLMTEMVKTLKKPVWSSPGVQTQMGAKDALTNIGHLSCGLPDTYTYFGEPSGKCAHFVGPDGMRKTCAFQPRVIKQNRGSAGEGIWLVWALAKDGKKVKKPDYKADDDSIKFSAAGGLPPYCSKLGEALLDDDDMLKLMEMNDNHIEYHTCAEFLEFCVNGPDTAKAGAQRPPPPQLHARRCPPLPPLPPPHKQP